MAKPEWGSKHRCSHCSAVFYDMKKNPILCPACGKTHEPETLLKARRTSRASAEAAKKAAEAKPAPVAEEVTKDLEVDDDDEGLVDMDDDDTLIEDDDIDDGPDGIADVAPAATGDEKET